MNWLINERNIFQKHVWKELMSVLKRLVRPYRNFSNNHQIKESAKCPHHFFSNSKALMSLQNMHKTLKFGHRQGCRQMAVAAELSHLWGSDAPTVMKVEIMSFHEKGKASFITACASVHSAAALSRQPWIEMNAWPDLQRDSKANFYAQNNAFSP